MKRRRLNLDGQRVLLTGASSGIGRVLAIALAGKGAVLALAARRRQLLEDLADEIEATGYRRPIVIATDLSKPGASAALAAQTLAEFGGGIDIVINNAGASVTGAQTLVGDSDPARTLFEINLWSPLALNAAVLPAMLDAGNGTIVNVTSTVQSVPLPLLGYYAASKAALAQATRSLRLELATTPIHVMEVVPGSTDTPLRDIGELPWRSGVPRTLPPASPASTATAIARALERRANRVVYPQYSLLPLELPAFGRLVAAVGGRQVDTASALRAH